MQHDVGAPADQYVGKKPSSAALRARVTPPWIVNLQNQTGQPPPRDGTSLLSASQISKPAPTKMEKREILNRLEFLTNELNSTHMERMALEAQLDAYALRAPRPAQSVASTTGSGLKSTSSLVKAPRAPGSTASATSAAVRAIAKQTVSFHGMD